MASVLASETTRKRIGDMINGLASEFEKSELIREAARLIVEEAHEGEVADSPRRELQDIVEDVRISLPKGLADGPVKLLARTPK